MAEHPKFHVTISPHVKDATTVAGIMWTVFAALLPQLGLAVWLFGPRVLALAGLSVAVCVGCEWAMQKAMGKPVTIRDGSAALTGLLLAYVLPPGVGLDVPFWGAVFSICIVKQLFGGLGYNFFNPALMARAFLVAGWPVVMTTAWVAPFAWSGGVDAVSTATPLFILKTQGIAALYDAYGSFSGVLKNFFLGVKPGCIGETSSLLLLLGGLFLLWKRIISWHIPVSLIATVGILGWIFGGEGWFAGNPLVHMFTGGVMLGAFFMATDYVTSPSQPKAKLLFGCGIGVLTIVIRLKGGYPEGICYAILLMNAVTPVLEQKFRPKRFTMPPKEVKV